MGTVNLPPIQSRGNKSTDEYLRYIAESLAILQEESQNVLEGRLSSANIRELTADKIITGTLLAQLVTIMSNLNGGAYIRIDGNGMVINDGIKDVFSVDITGLVTMTGAVVQSTAGYPKFLADPNGNLIGIFSDADTFMALLPSENDVPQLVMVDNGNTRGYLIRTPVGGTSLGTFGGEQLNLSPNGPLQIEGVNGYTGSINYVKSAVGDGMGGVITTYGTVTYKKGIVTNAT